MPEENSSPPTPQETQEDRNALDMVKLKDIYQASIGEAINVEVENNLQLAPILQRIADENNSVLMSFIAPSGGKKVSPYDTVSASIRTSEEFGIDKAMLDIKTLLKEREITTKPNLMLVINSPGGYVSSSYVVSRMIRDNFSDIKVFVPHVAASGGTLLALTGNEIVMGEMSRLSPLDTQLQYKGETVSAQSYQRAIERFEKYFKDKTQFEAPYPWKAMAEKFDPILMEEWGTELTEISTYLYNILDKAGYLEKQINRIIWNLIFTDFPHNFVINRDWAENVLKLKVKKDTDYPFIWEAMKAWYGTYYLKAESKHFIRYIVNNKR